MEADVRPAPDPGWADALRRILTRRGAPPPEALGPLVVAGLASFVVLYPFGLLFAEGLGAGLGRWLALFQNPSIRQAMANTLWASAAATVIATAAGAALAVATERAGLPGRPALRVGIMLPLLIPPFIAAFGWVQAYGPAGLAERAIGLQLPGLIGAAGVVMLLANHGVPLVYLPCVAALGAPAAAEAERAARVSGADARTTIRTVTLPLLRPALLAGAGLAFLSSASEFGAPAVVGLPGRFTTMTTEIYRQLTFSSSGAAFTAVITLAMTLAALALVILALIARLGRARAADSGRGGGGPALESTTRSSWLVLFLCWAFVLLVSLMPLLALLLVSLTRAYGLPQVPANWTLAHYGTALGSRYGEAVLHSAGLAAAAATGALALGTLLALTARRSRVGRWLSVVVALPYAVPGSTVAVATILAFNKWWYGTFAIILVAYLARFWALAERPTAGALSQLGPDLARAARVSGASALDAGWSVVLPSIRPALVAAWLLVFVSAFHELTISSLLYGPTTTTVAVVILDAQQAGQAPVTAALAVLLTAIVLACTLPVLSSQRLGRAGYLGR